MKKLREIAIFVGGLGLGAYGAAAILKRGITEKIMAGELDIQRFRHADGKWHVTTKGGHEINDERKEFQ